MGVLFIILFNGLGGWLLTALVRRLHRRHVRRQWWLIFGLLTVIGFALGLWGTCEVEYAASASFRVGGFPLPVVIFHLEDGQWVDFVVPKFQAWLTMLANALIVVGVISIPLWLATGTNRSGKPGPLLT